MCAYVCVRYDSNSSPGHSEQGRGEGPGPRLRGIPMGGEVLRKRRGGSDTPSPRGGDTEASGTRLGSS